MREPGEAVAAARLGRVLEIGLVEHDERGRRNSRDERLECRGAHPGAGGIVRVRDEHEPRRRRHRGEHRLEIVAERHRCMRARMRRHDDRTRPRRLHRERIHREAVLRIHRFGTGREERLREQHQHVVRAVAERQLRGRDIEARRERLLQRVAAAVGIDPGVGERGAHRRERRRTRAERILVRGELDDIAEPELARQLADRFAGRVRGDAAHARARELGRVLAAHGAPTAPPADRRRARGTATRAASGSRAPSRSAAPRRAPRDRGRTRSPICACPTGATRCA
ncbi:MAG: hypothetical protein CMLOHMNK_02779 [Steroidobacteraceae bacterium]|nr:hypothetical protein [Steroidobacteraceae bacterium]